MLKDERQAARRAGRQADGTGHGQADRQAARQRAEKQAAGTDACLGSLGVRPLGVRSLAVFPVALGAVDSRHPGRMVVADCRLRRGRRGGWVRG